MYQQYVYQMINMAKIFYNSCMQSNRPFANENPTQYTESTDAYSPQYQRYNDVTRAT